MEGMKPELSTDCAQAPSAWRLVRMGTFIVVVAAGMHALGSHSFSTQQPEVMLLYVGAEDCAPCRIWQKEYQPNFLASAEFAELWNDHLVATRRADAKRVLHPEVGLLDLLCETLISAVGNQTVVVLYPRPATDTREKLELLRVIGTQDLSVSS